MLFNLINKINIFNSYNMFFTGDLGLGIGDWAQSPINISKYFYNIFTLLKFIIKQIKKYIKK